MAARRPCVWAFLLTALLTLTPMNAVAAEEAEAFVVIKVPIKAGDSLSRIAARYQVSVPDLRRWNASKIGRRDTIRVGDVLVVHQAAPKANKGDTSASTEPSGQVKPERPSWEDYYTIRRGDTLSKIARKLQVSMDDLRRWNKLRAGKGIRAGDQLRYERPGERPPAKSMGRPTSGSLSGAVHLGKGRGYRLRFPKNAFGIPRLIRSIRHCAAEVRTRHPGSADILVGDISRPEGGRFPPHKSHQTGRDADIGYYLKGNVQNVTMHRVWPHDLDYAKNWDLLSCLIKRDHVLRVYMDTSIQKAMAAYLLSKKLASSELVARLFEFAAPKDTALIRHAPKHDTHIHVRVACEPNASECHEEPGDRVFRF